MAGAGVHRSEASHGRASHGIGIILAGGEEVVDSVLDKEARRRVRMTSSFTKLRETINVSTEGTGEHQIRHFPRRFPRHAPRAPYAPRANAQIRGQAARRRSRAL